MCRACASRRVHQTAEMKHQADPWEIGPSGTIIRVIRGETHIIARVGRKESSASASVRVLELLQGDGVAKVFEQVANFTGDSLIVR